MKHILILLSIFCLSTFSIAYADTNIYNDALDKLDEENELLNEELDDITRDISSNKKKDIAYYTLLISQSDKGIEIYQNKIDILQYLLICEDEDVSCSSKVFKDMYDEVEDLSEEITKLKDDIELTEEKIELYKKTLQGLEKEEALLVEERQQKAEEYFQLAEKKLADGDIKSAISHYIYSCNNNPSYNCYYALGSAYFLQAQEYYKNISSYGYDRLYTEHKNKALDSLDTAYGLSYTDEEKEAVNTLKIEIENYSNREEKKEEVTMQKPVENVENKQVEIIWSRIEKLTSDYSQEKKLATYKILVVKLEDYIEKTQDNNLKQTLAEIVKRLKKYEIQKEEISVYDRTKEFYKTSLQEKTYSCEISATSDILSTIKGKNFTEDELIKKIDKSSFNETAKYSNGIYIWGNPNAGYVGYIDKDLKGNIASQRNLTGYGVYEQPIANLYHLEGLKTEIINNSHYTTSFGPEQHFHKLLKEFTNGNYVQLWGDICTTPEYDDGELALADITQQDVDNGKNAKNECWSYGQDRKRVWYYKEGEELIKHQGLIGEHNFYLLGYEGSIDNPTNIIVWDTSTGKHTYPVKEWMRKWEEMDFRSIIIYSE